MSDEQFKEVCSSHLPVTSVREATLSSLSFPNLISCPALTGFLTSTPTSLFAILQVVTRSNPARTEKEAHY